MPWFETFRSKRPEGGVKGKPLHLHCVSFVDGFPRLLTLAGQPTNVCGDLDAALTHRARPNLDEAKPHSADIGPISAQVAPNMVEWDGATVLAIHRIAASGHKS